MLMNRKRISSTLDKTLYDALTHLSSKTRIPQSKLLDEAIKDLLIKFGNFKS